MNERTEYVEKLSAQIVMWDTQIEQLMDKAESSRPGMESDYSGDIAALQQKRNEAALRLQSVSIAGDDEWEELKAGTDQVWGELRSILRDTVLKIK